MCAKKQLNDYKEDAKHEPILYFPLSRFLLNNTCCVKLSV